MRLLLFSLLLPLWVSGCAPESDSYILVSDPAFEILRGASRQRGDPRADVTTKVLLRENNFQALLDSWPKEGAPQGVLLSPFWGNRWRDVRDKGIPVLVLGERTDEAPSLIFSWEEALGEGGRALAEALSASSTDSPRPNAGKGPSGRGAALILMEGERLTWEKPFREGWEGAGGNPADLERFSLERDRQREDLRRFITTRRERGIDVFVLLAGRFNADALEYLAGESCWFYSEGPSGMTQPEDGFLGFFEIPFSRALAEGREILMEQKARKGDFPGNITIPVRFVPAEP